MLKTVLATFCIALSLAAPVWADVSVSAQMLEARVRQYILQNTPNPQADTALFVDIQHLPYGNTILKGNHITYTFSDSRPDTTTYRTVVQVVMSTDTETKQVGIPVHIVLSRPVWVATHLIRSGQPLTASDVTLQTKRLDYDAAFALGKGDTVTNYTSRVNIAPGAVVDLHKVSATPVVLHDEDVHMILSMANGMQVSVIARALQDGAMGQNIHLSRTLADSRIKTYTGEVIGKNLVQVKM